MRTEQNPATTLKMVVVAMAGNVDLSMRQIQNLVKQNSEWIF